MEELDVLLMDSEYDEYRLRVTSKDFLIGRRLGSGAFGVVHQAKHTTSGTMLAIKSAAKQVYDKDMRNALAQEIRTQMIVKDHPHVLMLYGFYEDPFLLFLVVDFAANGCLRGLISKRIPLPHTARIFMQVSDAVAYCHEKGILHRDIKPDNILLDSKFSPLLSDFGLAASFSPNQPRSTCCGTAAYMCPEVLSLPIEYTTKSDTWSLGVLLFEMVVGVLPFPYEQGMTESQMIERITNCHVKYPSDMDSKAKELVQRLVIRDPHQRLHAIEIKGHPFRNTAKRQNPVFKESAANVRKVIGKNENSDEKYNSEKKEQEKEDQEKQKEQAVTEDRVERENTDKDNYVPHVTTASRLNKDGTSSFVEISYLTKKLIYEGKNASLFTVEAIKPRHRIMLIKRYHKGGLIPNEIMSLSRLSHSNIVDLFCFYTETVEKRNLCCLLMEYLPEDAQKLREKGIKFDLLDAKLYSFQLLRAVEYMDVKSIIHLDIKPANLLIDHNFGILKLADFGNAEILGNGKELKWKEVKQGGITNSAPELLLKTKAITTAVDTWSVACCIYDFIMGRELFKGRSAADQMKLIVDAFGFPTEEEIKAMRISRPKCGRPSPKGIEKVAGSDFPKAALEILKGVLVYNPKKRMTPSECLKSTFFDAIRANPAPTRWNGSALPSFIKGEKKDGSNVKKNTVSVYRVRGPGSEEEMSITFESERLCGNGRFSNVYSASLTSPSSMRVAVKKIREEKNRPPIVGLHSEISILSQLDHPNIISLLYHYVRTIENEKLHCLVLEYLPEDAQKLREKGIKFDLLDAKLYSFQLLRAVEYMDEKLIIHLDIKPANLLIDHNFGILKLADFGNAQVLVPGTDQKQQQPYQVTRYYGAPELVFCTKYLTIAVDTWSVACCVYDFIMGRVLFKGRSTDDQMKLLLDAFGYPTEEEIKAMRISRPKCGRPSPKGIEKVAGSDFPKAALEILKGVLVFNPKKRMTPSECLKSTFFDAIRANPAPTRWNGSALPSFIKGEKKDNDSNEEDK